MTEEELREKMNKDLNGAFDVKSIIDFQFDLLQKAYTKGLETGIKVGRPQWHYMKDGDLPKDEKDMLMSEQLILLTKMKGTDNLNLSIGQYNFSTQEFSYPHFVGLTDVIAWKEIVLPKESE